jgi:hypothetical protein
MPVAPVGPVAPVPGLLGLRGILVFVKLLSAHLVLRKITEEVSRRRRKEQKGLLVSQRSKRLARHGTWSRKNFAN